MAFGRLAAVVPSITTNTLIHLVTERTNLFKATINIANMNTSDATIRLAIVDGGVSDLTAADYIEYDVVIRTGGLMERTLVELTPGQSIVGYSDTADVSFQVWA